MQNRALQYADSVFKVRRSEIELMHQQALQEVTDYRIAATAQVDTMRANFLKLKKTKIYSNMIIRGDTLHKASTVFGPDSIPKLITND